MCSADYHISKHAQSLITLTEPWHHHFRYTYRLQLAGGPELTADTQTFNNSRDSCQNRTKCLEIIDMGEGQTQFS